MAPALKSVISYFVSDESDTYTSHFRFHEVLDLNDKDAIREQVQKERGEVPVGVRLEWWGGGAS